VDPALVHHYFGTKDELFLAALELPVDPRKVLLPAIAAGGVDGAAERMLRAFLSVWDDPEIRVRLVAVFRGVLDAEGERLLRDGFLPVVLEPVGVALGIDRPELRMPIVASQMVGLIMLRYVIGVEPLASLSGDEVVAIYAPTIQRYLTGDLT
jgi:AcrR family transcriptional regulator